MNLTSIFITLTTALGASVSYAVLEPSIAKLVEDSQTHLAVIDKTNREQTLKAATVMWQVARATQETPTAEQLVSDGYLDPKFMENK